MSDGQKGNIWTTIIVVVLIAGLLLIFSLLRRGGCAPGSEQQPAQTTSGGGAPTKEPTGSASSDTVAGPKADSITLENGELKLSFLAWPYHPGFRITQAELKEFTRKKDAKSTERILVNLLEESGFEVLGKKDTSLAHLRFAERSDTSVTFVWEDTLGNERLVSVHLSGLVLRIIQSDSLEPLLFHCPAGLAPTEPGDKTELTLYQLYYRDGQKSINYLNAKRIGQVQKGKREIESGPYEWVALRSKYFAAIVLPSRPVVGKIIPDVTDDRLISMGFDVESGREFTLYFGPQDYDTLTKMGHKLSRVVELGGSAFRWLGVIILKIFQFLYKIIGNYGVAIIIFAILIKLVFLPLSRYQQRSMQKMQVLQPKLKELQERYKDDPKRMQEETNKLYRAHGTSPLETFKGCLPMLIQLPVFFGLYAVLRSAIDLRGASFVRLFTVTVKKSFDFLFIHVPAGEVTWLANLSEHDPFYILPVLMGVASVLQSLRTATGPRNRLTALIFPILITVVFLNFPSGLQLYWLVFSLLSLLEFVIFRRGAKPGEAQWQKNKISEIASAKSLPKSSPR